MPGLQGLALVGLLTSYAGGANAQPPPSRTVVLMVPDLDDDSDERAEATIAAHLQDSDVTLLVRTYAPDSLDLRSLLQRSNELLEASDGRGILWIELGDDPALYVLTRGSTQIHGRIIDGGDVGEAVALESLANVAATAAVAVAEGRAIELTPEPEPELEPEPEPEPEPEARPEPHIEVHGVVIPKLEPRTRLRIGYRGQSYASGLPWLSAVELGFGWRPVPNAHIELAYEASTPVTVAANGLDLQLQLFRAPASLLGGYRFDLRRGWAVEVAGRVSLEPTRRHTIAGDTLAGTEPSWRVLAAAGLDVRATKAIGDDLRLTMGLGLVGVFVRSEYVLADIDQPLLRAAPLRFAAAIGFDFDLIHR